MTRTLRPLPTLGVAAAALMLGLAPAVAQDASSAVIRVGSLYEPQNLDNTAGAGQGINEAFNDNVYEALYRLADSGEVQPVLDARMLAQELVNYHPLTNEATVTIRSADLKRLLAHWGYQPIVIDLDALGADAA